VQIAYFMSVYFRRISLDAANRQAGHVDSMLTEEVVRPKNRCVSRSMLSSRLLRVNCREGDRSDGYGSGNEI
jgi:hypothetical protein